MPSLLTYALIADSLKENAFNAKSAQLKTLVSDLWSSGPHTFIVHLGEALTIHSQSLEGKIRTTVVGDKENKVVTIVDHGTGLVGPVSVYMSAMDDLESHLTCLTMEVHPISDKSETLLGVIWMNDVQSIGPCARIGQTLTVSIDQLLVPDRRLFRTAFMGTMRQFTLGITTTAVYPEDSRIVISQLIGDTIIITPFGISLNGIADIYQIPGYKLNRQPEGLSDTRFAILKVVFEDGVTIFNQNAVRVVLKKKDLDEDETLMILRLLNGMAKQGEWLTSQRYVKNIYYIPTPKLLTSI